MTFYFKFFSCNIFWSFSFPSSPQHEGEALLLKYHLAPLKIEGSSWCPTVNSPPPQLTNIHGAGRYYTHYWRRKVFTSFILVTYSNDLLHFLRQDLSLNLEIAVLNSVASHCTSKIRVSNHSFSPFTSATSAALSGHTQL